MSDHHSPVDSLVHAAHTVHPLHTAIDGLEAGVHTAHHGADHASHALRATINNTRGFGGTALSAPTADSMSAVARTARLARMANGLGVANGVLGAVMLPGAVADGYRGVRDGNLPQAVSGISGAVGGTASIANALAILGGGGAHASTAAAAITAAGGGGGAAAGGGLAASVAGVAAPVAAAAAAFGGGFALGNHGNEATRHYNTFGDHRSASDWAGDTGGHAYLNAVNSTYRNGIFGTGIGAHNDTAAEVMGHASGIPATLGASIVGAGASVMNAGRSGVDWIRGHLPF